MQVGPCTGISMGDDLWMSRYLMYRLAGEQEGAKVESPNARETLAQLWTRQCGPGPPCAPW